MMIWSLPGATLVEVEGEGEGEGEGEEIKGWMCEAQSPGASECFLSINIAGKESIVFVLVVPDLEVFFNCV